ncbi:MAG: BamA/TamA family outer membrane protein [Candidatus Symbiothrix sp.]|nr:BamA/TamA family outer membrane protein [Candidatus Symbiothrix sp.]
MKHKNKINKCTIQGAGCKVHPCTLHLAVLLLLLASCSTTKNIPEGRYLLEKVNLEVKDKGVDKSVLFPYIQQKPNTSAWSVKMYNLVKNDSGFIKKFIRKMGEAPVIFNDYSVNLTVNELTMELRNRGYLNARVTAQTDTANKKASVTYTVLNREPYRIRNYTNDIPSRLFARRDSSRTDENRFANLIRRNIRERNSPGRSLIKEDAVFDMNLLERERKRINTLLRNQGYYTTSEDNLHFLADTTLQSGRVDLNLILLDTASVIPYTIQRVNVYSGYDPLYKEDYLIRDSLEYKDIHIYYDHLHFLRPSVISEKILVRPGSLFRERNNTSTLSLLRAQDCVSQVSLQYAPGNYPDSTLLDCNIYLTPGNIHSLQTGLEGTYKAGDMGVALNVNYGHLNIFNGSEIFNINSRFAYELIAGKPDGNALVHNYYEWSIRPSLTFPEIHLPFIGSYMKKRFNLQTQYSLGYNIQRRPEYIRNFFNFNWKFRWAGQTQLITHTLSILDVNYVFMPRQSEDFENYLEKMDPLTQYSYSDVFTAGMNYGLVYTNAPRGSARRHLYTLRLNVETSGNTLAGLAKMMHVRKSEYGRYNIFGNPFAQYVRVDADLAHTFRLNPENSLAFHAGIGYARPYGNSAILPFEKRYYAGGPNHVRGWSTRYLGPGSYNEGLAGDPTTHVGDINLIVSAEYRFKLMSWLEPAFFVDCGNIWTVDNYADQPDGVFHWNKFYRELAVGSGLGLRFDLSFLILRIDAGTKIFDPARKEGNRRVLFKEKFFKNSAVYVAIGYPF